MKADSKPTVVVISGKARSGKDTFARLLMEELFATGECHSVLITHYADLLKYLCSNLFGWNGEKDEEGRTLLQYVGTDVVRKKNPNFWVEFMGNILDFFGNQWEYVIIPDARFPNEVTYLRDQGFDVAHLAIERNADGSQLTAIQQQHASEIAMDNIKPDISINNNGTMAELKAKAAQTAEVLNTARDIVRVGRGE